MATEEPEMDPLLAAAVNWCNKCRLSRKVAALMADLGIDEFQRLFDELDDEFMGSVGDEYNKIKKSLQQLGVEEWQLLMKPQHEPMSESEDEFEDPSPTTGSSELQSEDVDIATSSEVKDVDIATSSEVKDVDIATSSEVKDLDIDTAPEVKDVDIATSSEVKDVHIETASEVKDVHIETASEVKDVDIATSSEVKDVVMDASLKVNDDDTTMALSDVQSGDTPSTHGAPDVIDVDLDASSTCFASDGEDGAVPSTSCPSKVKAGDKDAPTIVGPSEIQEPDVIMDTEVSLVQTPDPPRIDPEIQSDSGDDLSDAPPGGAPMTFEPADRPDLYNTVLEKAELSKFYPGRITLEDVMKIGEGPSNVHHTATGLCVHRYLKKLVMLDFKARDTMDQQKPRDADCSAPGGDPEEMEEEADLFGFEEKKTSPDVSIHPQDYLYLAYLCCDLNLQRVLSQKLFYCRLAIPFLHHAPGKERLQMTAWPLRHIVPGWKKTDGEMIDLDALSSPAHFVSFLRVGKSENFRKSKIVNDILSDEVHNTFFHWDCPNGTRKREITDGIVEASWYLPSGKPSDILPNLTMVMNLRGHCLQFPEALNHLRDISTVMVFVVESRLLADVTFAEMLRCHVWDAEVDVILLVTVSVIHQAALKAALSKFRQNMGGEAARMCKLIPTCRGQELRNMTEVKDDLRREIRHFCAKKTPQTLLEAATAAAISTDEDLEKFRETRRLVDAISGRVRALPVAELKRSDLPLQGDLWQVWSQLRRVKNRPSHHKDGLSLEGEEKILQSMKNVRIAQRKACMNPSQLTVTFMEALLHCHSQGDLQFFRQFIQYLKTDLDALCRARTPEFHRRYEACWARLQQRKDKLESEAPELRTLQEEVKAAEKDLVSMSFGTEHLFREIGQMYEAIKERPAGFKNTTVAGLVNQLPEMMARMLLTGNAMELMDGDACNIPVTWISAVLRCLGKLVGEKKIFILSVLGVQSSGKSTLLNTMFGLEFAVSAGRCTKGVYLQLVQVKADSGLPFDYVCVVDTEGLRAPELGMMKYDHDNELATLAIGLGDVTIMNVKGENYAEMKDVLQIAVHAFLRMKMACKYESHHRCIFIHQNVPAVNAAEKMKMACQKLQENLDLMTLEAAEQENNLEIRTFNQIITFDCLKDVYFFPDLWRGDPPMAPANPGYSEAVMSVREKLFSQISIEQTGFSVIGDLSTRIKDLWDGIMADDFVFSFRNSLEVKAYNGLENKFQQLVFDVDEKLYDWEKKVAEVRIKGSGSKDELQSLGFELEKELEVRIGEITQAQESALTEYCQRDTYSEIIVQWQQNKLNNLRAEIDKKTKRLKDNVGTMLQVQEVDIFANRENDQHMREIISQTCRLAQDMRSRAEKDVDLKKEFQNLWTKLSVGLDSSQRSLISPDKIAADILSELFGCLSSHKGGITEELRKNSLQTPLSAEVTKLQDSLDIGDISTNHFSVTSVGPQRKMAAQARSFFKGDSSGKKEYVSHVLRFLNGDVMARADKYLNSLSDKQPFTALTVKTLVSTVLARLKERVYIAEKNAELAILAALECKMAVHVCRFAFPRLCAVQSRYEEKYGYKSKILSYRETLWNMFRNAFDEKSDEFIAADFLVDQFREKVKQETQEALPNHVKLQLVKMFRSKQSLIRDMMLEMADAGEFDKYQRYITDPKRYAGEWIKARGLAELTRAPPAGQDNLLAKLTAEIILETSGRIRASLHATKVTAGEVSVPIASWVTEFCKSAAGKFGTTPADYPISRAANSAGAELVLRDPASFLSQVLARVDKMEDELMQTMVRDVTPGDGISTLFAEITDATWGCNHVCPFCGEPCILCEGHNVAHHCLQHRPQGLGKYKKSHSKMLALESCNYYISSETTFSNADTNQEKVKYKDYLKLYPYWDIQPNPDMAESSPYWTWYLTKFLEEHCRHAEAEKPEIPESWRLITLEQAKDSVKTVYS